MPAPLGHPPYNVNGEGGRPKIYTKEFIEDMADKFEVFMKREDVVWYEEFCVENDIEPDLLSMWAKENKRFSGVYNKSKTWQKSKLIKGGLLSTYNSTITKLVLHNTIGWSDKNDNNTKVSGLQEAFKDITDTSRDLVNNQDENE
jgi:hypothetical protein